METKTTAAAPLVMHTVGEAATLAGISQRDMQIHIAAGTGPDVTRIGKCVRIRDDRLRKWIDEQTQGGTMGVPSAQDRDAIAEKNGRAIKCYMRRDPAGAAEVINSSRYHPQLHAAAALHVIARMADEADDPE